MKHILVLHGPNLNLLGTRDPSTYGHESLSSIDNGLKERAQAYHIRLTTLQSNHEGVLVDAIHNAAIDKTDYLIFNPAAFTHTSAALRDALLAVQIPFIEVHISNIYAREQFRHVSYFSDIASGVISGFGTNGYMIALESIINV